MEVGESVQPTDCLLVRQATPMLDMLVRLLHEVGCSAFQLGGIPTLVLAFQRCLAHALVLVTQAFEGVMGTFDPDGLGKRGEPNAPATIPSQL